jgi:DNA-binding transcriptional MerR regulator
MQIGQLAKLAQVTPRTIRYYESLGLLYPHEREGSGFRYYGPDALARLKKIEYLKNLDFSLDEIGSVIELYFSESSNYLGKLKIIEILQAHLKEVDEKIDSLQQFRNEIIIQIAKMQQLVEETRNS